MNAGSNAGQVLDAFLARRRAMSLFILFLLAVFPAYAAERGAKPATAVPTREASAGKVDVNTADLQALQSLPGVGRQIAQAIIDHRPYKTVAELERVPGIGSERLKDLRKHVRASPPAAAKAAAKAAGQRPTGRIDVNTASVEMLESLPGVGRQTAEAIVEARPFKAVDELENVRGIGPAKMRELRDYVMVSRTAGREVGRAARRPATESTRSEPRPRSEAATERTTPARSAAGDRASGNPETRPVNLNTASREELEALPEIGPVKAQAIIEARPFSSIEDVMRVKGIKEGTFEAIRDQITVR